MCKVLEDMLNEVIERERIEITNRLIVQGKMTLDEIAEISRLTPEKVQELAQQKSA